MTRFRFVSIPLIIAVGLVSTFALSYTVYIRSVEKSNFEFERLALDRSLALQRSIHSAMMAGKSVVGLFAASESVTKTEFASFAQVLIADIPYIQALEWAPLVVDANRASLESELDASYPSARIHERDVNGSLVAAAQRSEYLPVQFLEPVNGNEKALGFDLVSNSTRRLAIEKSRELNIIAATERVSLIQSSPGQWGLLMFFPVYKNHTPIDTAEQRRRNYLGSVVVVFEILKLVESSLAFVHSAGLHITIKDARASDDKSFLYFHRSRLSDMQAPQVDLLNQALDSELSFVDVIEVADREWELLVTPAQNYYAKVVTMEVYVVLVCGIGATLVLLAYVQLLQKNEQKLRQDKGSLERLVEDRTKELQEHIDELESYSYSIAHDLRAPLRAITSFTQIVITDSKDRLSEEEKNHLSRVIAAGKHLAELIDDILDHTRIARGKLDIEEVDLSELARRIAGQIDAVRAGLEKITWKIQPDVAVKGDPKLLYLVFENLLGNAQKFTTKVSGACIEFGESRADGDRCFYVKDNGVGFDQSYAKKIFGVFQRLHTGQEYEGTGIGLATVQRIIARHGGRVWAEGELGKGATLFFTLDEHGKY